MTAIHCQALWMMAGWPEQRLFRFGLARRGERRQIRVAETALDRGGLDGFAADRAGFGIVVHAPHTTVPGIGST